MKPSFWKVACRDLSADCPKMKGLIHTYRGEILRGRGQAFETLLRSIVGQQISVKAAQSVWEKLVITVGGEMRPEAVLAVSPEAMRAAGLSSRKVEYALDLAGKFISGEVDPTHWQSLDDEAVILELTRVRGIGRWTAEMFLIFHLLRPNVFPKDDIGLQKALAKVYGKRYPLSQRQLELFRRQFDPWASVATWYLWRSLDPIPVEY